MAKLAEREDEPTATGERRQPEPAGRPTRTPTGPERPAEHGRPEPSVPAYAGSSFAYFASSFLTPTRVEADGDLQIVVVLFDGDHRADAELRVPHAHAGAHTEQRLILVLVGVSRSVFRALPAAALAAVRVRSELVVAVREVALVGDVNAGAMRSTSSAGISSRNRDGSVD